MEEGTRQPHQQQPWTGLFSISTLLRLPRIKRSSRGNNSHSHTTFLLPPPCLTVAQTKEDRRLSGSREATHAPPLPTRCVSPFLPPNPISSPQKWAFYRERSLVPRQAAQREWDGSPAPALLLLLSRSLTSCSCSGSICF